MIDIKTNSSFIYCDQNLRLRPHSESDIAIATNWYADPVVIKGTISPSRTEPCSYEMIQAMYKDLSNTGEFYIIEFLEQKNWIAIGDVTLSENAMPIVIGDSKFRNMGLAKKVITTLLHYAKLKGWDKITLKEIFKKNSPSQKLFESCGFIKISETEKSFIYEVNLRPI